MRVDKNIEQRGDRYVIYMYDEYKGSYNTLKEAKKARDMMKKDNHGERRKVKINGFTERLNDAIWHSDLDIKEISRRTGITRCNIWNYQNGIAPKIDNLASLAVVLNVSTDWLLGLEDKYDTRMG